MREESVRLAIDPEEETEAEGEAAEEDEVGVMGGEGGRVVGGEFEKVRVGACGRRGRLSRVTESIGWC